VVSIAPGKEGVVDKLRAVIAVDAVKGEGEGGADVREGLQYPFLGFIEEGAEFCSVGGDAGDGEGEVGPKVHKLAGVPLRLSEKSSNGPTTTIYGVFRANYTLYIAP
jgi:hypothetical protein